MQNTVCLSDMSDKKINKLLYETLKLLLPPSFNLQMEHITSSSKLSNILVQVHNNLPRIMPSQPGLKATYLLCIAQSLNNRVCASFVPENYNNIKECLCLQKIALAYCKTAIVIFNKNSIKLYFEQVNQLNYWYNVIEANLNIIAMSDIGHIHNEELFVYQKTFMGINKRVSALIKKSPEMKYFKLQALLLRYLNQDLESIQTIRRSLTMTKTAKLSNIKETYYREQYRGKKHPVVIYTI